VLFVHGTGVRGVAYSKSYRQIAEGVAGLPESGRLSGCFWGEAGGVPEDIGRSVPTYETTRGGRRTREEEELALWSVLYTDPWYELRLLRYAADEVSDLPPGEQPPSEALKEQLAEFNPSVDLRAKLRRLDLEAEFDAALAALRAAPEFDDAAATADPTLVEHRRAVARALVAHALADPTGQYLPTIDGATRDDLVEQLTDELGGYGRGISEWLARPFKGVAAWGATRYIRRRRGSVSDGAAPGAGDILRYQARGDGIRALIRQAIVDTRAERVTLLAHSLGGIACVDLLVGEHLRQVDRLITVGSQAPFLYEIGALWSLEAPAELPDHFPAWLNIYDPCDFLAYVGAPMFPSRVRDVEVDNGQPFPQAHSAYWTNRQVWDAVGKFMS
jgi:hypothetical protein